MHAETHHVSDEDVAHQMTTAENPFGAIAHSDHAGVEVAQSREVAEVQSAVVMARRFPRDQRKAMDRILTDCTRITLANAALYAYKRGSEIVSGPSIRLAESIARSWGNLTFGIREMSNEGGASQVEAFAWDLETNTRASKVFQVKHARKAQGSIKTLTDPRDIYELVANMGARRMRACILAIIPGDVVEAAVVQCELTQTNQAGSPKEQVEEMLKAFEAIGVSRELIAKRLGHKPEASKAAEILNMRRIYRSIVDGIAKPSEFFEIAEEETGDTKELSEKIRNRGKGNEGATA